MIKQWFNSNNSGNGTTKNGHDQQKSPCLIEMQAVVKKYHTAASDFTALKDVDLQVDSGEYLAVVGKSGSGKSTLINMITGIDKPTSGQVMAALLAVVGGMGLTGTMSINVLERRREIGVMRSIGASDGAVLKLVMVEGMLIGLLSWLIAMLLAIPLSGVLSYAVGQALLQTPFEYAFSIAGALLWLLLVVIISLVASYVPARNASRLTVREVLAYE